MNILTHIALSFALLVALFPSKDPVTLLIFSIVFGGLMDLDCVIMPLLHKKKITSWRRAENFWRTFIQEPFGLFIIGFPAAIIMETIVDGSFWLVIIPYAGHIIIDYLSMHDVRPLAPFSSKRIRVGYIRGFAKPRWHRERRGIPEAAIAIGAIGLLIVLL